MRYVMVVQLGVYPVAPARFAVESAFAEHLRALRQSIGSDFDRVVLVAPIMPDALYQAQRQHLDLIDGDRDGVFLVPAHPEEASAAHFWLRHAPRLFRQVSAALAGGGIVHSGMSTDIWRPLMAFVNIVAFVRRQPVVFFVDIDFRLHSRRLRQLGLWSRKSYLTNRMLHDRFKLLQLWLAPRMFDLVMLKSRSMVEHFGQRREHVKNFFDVVHTADQIVSDEELEARVADVASGKPLRLAYFGRLAVNKGVDRMIKAVDHAKGSGVHVHLSVIGDGPCLADLRRLAASLGVEDRICFVPQVRYGAELFALLRDIDISLAAPLVEDTPRSAFDSMARGLPIVAFDISYFRDLAEMSGAVALAQWPEPGALARRIVELDRDRGQVQAMMRRAVRFASDNTQQQWLARRADWMRRYALRRIAPAAPRHPDMLIGAPEGSAGA